jgi:hypothetical protein
MKHPSSQLVLRHWSERRRGRPAPERGDIDPAAIPRALGDTFMLAADFTGELRFRLAGTRVCALFCREVKGWTFTDLWDEESRSQIDPLLAALSEERTGAVAGVTGERADGHDVELELLLLPLAYRGQARIRALGVLAPMQPPCWLGEVPLVQLSLRTMRNLGAEADTSRILPAGASRKHGFVVYPGGLEAGSPPAETRP